VKTDEAALAGIDRVRAEYTKANRVFATTEVGHVSAAPTDRTVERFQDVKGCVDSTGYVPLICSHENVPAGELIVTHATEVCRYPIPGRDLGATGVLAL
jgi:hypothetical protein